MPVRSVRDLTAAARGRRQELGLSQAELAKRIGISRKWISEFETGKPTVELGLVLRVLDELGFQLELRHESVTKPRDRGAIDLDTLLEQFRHSDERRRQ